MANCDSVQEYIDSLKADLAKANDDFLLAQKTEQWQLNLLNTKKSWFGFLQKIFNQLTTTDQLATVYIGLLGRSVKQASKVARNSFYGIKGLQILLCQLKQVSDCVEMLRIIIDQLKERISIPTKDAVIFTGITNLQKAAEESLAAIKTAITALLNTYQVQEELFKSIDGDDPKDRGIVSQLSWMQMQVLYGYNANPEADCKDEDGNCTKQGLLFPMKNGSKFYQKIKSSLENLPDEIIELTKNAINDTCEREIKQAKKDALQNALTAAEAAKSCDPKK